MEKISYDYDTVIEYINGKPTSDRTTEKEKWGDLAIKDCHLWDTLFPNNTGWKKVNNKKEQKAGIDYKIFDEKGDEINIDIKVCIGPDYSSIPLEIYQRPVNEPDVPSSYTFTNNSYKLTDYMLYLTLDRSGFRYYLIPYETIREVSKLYKWHMVETMSDKGLCYKRVKPDCLEKSFNGTGYYVKIDPNELFNIL